MVQLAGVIEKVKLLIKAVAEERCLFDQRRLWRQMLMRTKLC